jgi:hypothetical protein
LGIDELYGALNELLDFRPEVQRSEASDGDRHAIFAIEAAVLSGATQLERTCQVLERLKARLEAAKQEAGGHEDARVRRMIQLLTYSRRLSYRFEGSEVLREDFQEIRDALRFVAPFRLEP